MGIPSSASTTPLSPLGEACLRTDLTAIHEILEKLSYKDDEGAATEVSFLILNLVINYTLVIFSMCIRDWATLFLIVI